MEDSDRGSSRSNRAGPDGAQRRRREGRKERVMHTRISDDLDAAIRRAAEELRVPVSNLVRNVLEDAFTVVETVRDNFGELVDDVVEEAGELGERLKRSWNDATGPSSEAQRERRARPRRPEPDSDLPEFPRVVGWQPLVLNGRQECDGCGRALLRGDRAFSGMSAEGRPIAYLCEPCAERLH